MKYLILLPLLLWTPQVEAPAPSLRQLVEEALRARVPVLGPVEIHWDSNVVPEGYKGFTRWEGTKWAVYIRPGEEPHVLVHEWAHIKAAPLGGEPHGPYWGLAMSQCWQAVYER